MILEKMIARWRRLICKFMYGVIIKKGTWVCAENMDGKRRFDQYHESNDTSNEL